jgi:hypothetical protein
VLAGKLREQGQPDHKITGKAIDSSQPLTALPQGFG